MADTASSNFSWGQDVQDKLKAAGVTDDASLRAALERDPGLQAELEAALRANPQAMRVIALQALVEQFDKVQDQEQLLEFYRAVPEEMEQPLIEAIESAIQNAAPEADKAAVENWRIKLDDFRNICQQAKQAQNLSPVQRAVIAFSQAPDETAARQIFAAQRALLQPYEAQQFLDAWATQMPPETPVEVRQRLADRAELLRVLRGAAAAPSTGPNAVSIGADNSGPINTGTQTTFNNQHMQVDGNLYQAQTITITNVMNLARHFSRPAPPRLPKDLVVRDEELNAVMALIEAQGTVSISSIGKPNAVTMQGMAGVGKTMLARLLAQKLDGAYPDGVLWEDIGPNLRAPEDARPILLKWAGMYVGDITSSAQNIEPDALRALINEHPRLLVILDNVWSFEGIRLLRAALPAQARVVITTRSQEVMNLAGGGQYAVGLLSQQDALELVYLRLKWGPESPTDQAWVTELIERLGRHPLALDVALGLMHSEGLAAAEWRTTAMRVIAQVREGKAFETLKRPEDMDKEANVAAAVWVSYQALNPTQQTRYRALGAFAPETDFSTALAAAVWGCAETEARQTLTLFSRRALLDATNPDKGHWKQHAVLRGYALALLRQTGEAEPLAARHAAACNAAMRVADQAQRYHPMWPLYAQLSHAFGWAQDNDLDLALDLINNCANLQKQFGKAGDGLRWAQTALAMAQTRAVPAQLARAQGTLGNRLQEAATLPGEDRRARLLQALQAYDLALEHYRPDTAPLDYAATQNNRASRLSDIATLPGEDRRARLLQALQAYDLALEHYRPDTAPLDYAATQNNRATLLSAIATLPGEDRRARLLQALQAYDLALEFRRPDTAPLDYAATQNNRANRLSDIATLPGEDRRARLLQALQAYDLALEHYRPDTAPLDYAATQNNRATLLSAIATLPGEDRRARLLQALQAYDLALEFRRPDTAPLDYAATQNNRANLLSAIATLPGEDRRARLLQALQAYDLALEHYRPDTAPLDYAATQNNRATLLSAIATLPGEDRRARLLAALEAYDLALEFRRPDTAPLDYAMTQGNLLNLYQVMAILPEENKKMWLIKACQAGWNALTGFQLVQHFEYEERAKMLLRDLRQECGGDFAVLWAQAGLGPVPEWLAQPSGQTAVSDLTALETAVREYAAQLEAAQKAEKDPAAWQRAADAGEGVLGEAGKLPSAPGLEEWRANFLESLTYVYNMLGNALDETDTIQSLAAFERAIVLRPEFAMVHRNRAGTLIELGRLDEAEQAIVRARHLEPGAERLAILDKELAEARQKENAHE